MQLHLHIGTPRTGTTSFQESLSKLAPDSGIYIPRTGVDLNSFGLSHHGLVEVDEAARGKGAGEFRLNMDALNDLKNELMRSSQFEHVILSSENFSSLRVEDIYKFRDYIGDIDLRIIVSFRDAVSLFKSLWNVRVQNGWAVDLCDAHKVLLKDIWFSNCINPLTWMRVVGDGKVRCVRYEPDPQRNLSNLYKGIIQTILPEMKISDLSSSNSSREISYMIAANKMITYLQHPTEIERQDTWVPSDLMPLRNSLVKVVSEEDGINQRSKNFIQGYIVEQLGALDKLVSSSFFRDQT